MKCGSGDNTADIVLFGRLLSLCSKALANGEALSRAGARAGSSAML